MLRTMIVMHMKDFSSIESLEIVLQEFIVFKKLRYYSILNYYQNKIVSSNVQLS